MNSFMIRAKARGKDNHSQFLQTSTAAVGWGRSGDVSKISEKEVKENLATKHNCIGHGAAAATTAIYGVYNAKIGDIVVMPVDRNIYIGKVTQTYWYNPSNEDAAHIIGVEWNKKPFPVESLSYGLQRSLKNLRTFSSLNQHVQELAKIYNGTASSITVASTGKVYFFKYGGDKIISVAGIQDRIEEETIDNVGKCLKEILLKEGKLIKS